MLDSLVSSLPGLALLSANPGARAASPLQSLMLWAALLWGEGALDPRLLARTGFDARQLEALAAEHPAELEQLRWLRFTGQMFTRDSLAELLRARLGELMMGATKASEILALTKALERLPDWAQADPAAAPGAAQSAEDAQSGLEALQLLREMLDTKYEACDPEELSAMLSRAEELAGRLDGLEGRAAPPERSRAHKAASGKKRVRRQ